MTLEEIIRAEAKKGRLSHLSLVSARTGLFEASYRSTDGNAPTSFAVNPDPVLACAQAILGQAKAKRMLTEPESTMRYWFHPESSSLFTTKSNEPEPGTDGLLEEVDQVTYSRLKAEITPTNRFSTLLD